MKGEINPPLRNQIKIHHEAVMVELKAIAGGEGLKEKDFTRYGAIPVPNQKNCFTVPMADEAAAERLVSIFGGHLEVPVGDGAYHFHVGMFLEGDETEPPPPRGDGNPPD